MKVFLTGATGVMGTSAVSALRAAGHDVGGLVRTPEKAQRLAAAGVRPVVGSLFDADLLTEALEGYDAVCNLATHVPMGVSGAMRGAWRAHDRIRSEGSAVVAEAAKRAGVLRLVQESMSLLYADGDGALLDERSPLMVTSGTESAAEAETNATAFACAHRAAVVLRFGNIVSDDPMARCWLVRAGLGAGDPDGWAHVVHADDIGTAVVAALHAPTGVYNVGADPVVRGELTEALCGVAGQQRSAYLPRVLLRLGGERVEPLTRSLRVSSARLREQTGWLPRHPRFSGRWLEGALVAA